MAELISLVVSFFNNLFNINAWEDQLYESASVNFGTSNALAEENWKRSEESADNAFVRQKQLWNHTQSPRAMFDQYKSLGASSQAALMAALGVGSPSMSAPMASSSSPSVGGAPFGTPFNGDVAEILNAFQNSANSFFNNQRTAAETESININNQWQSTLNDASVKKILFNMDMDLKRYGLDREIYENVTKPTANSLIDLNTQEIKNKQQQWQNLCQEYYNLQAQFHETMSKVRNLDANTALANAQTQYTSGALTDKTVAETGLVQQQTETEQQETIFKRYEAKIKGLEARVSGLIGIPISLPMSNILYGKAKIMLNSTYEQGKDNLDQFLQSQESHFNKIKRGVDVAFKKGVAYLQDIDNRKRAIHFAKSFMDGYFKGHTEYMRKRDRIFKRYE